MTSKGLTQHHKAAELLPQGELAKEFANEVGVPFKFNLDVLGDPSSGKVFSGEDKITLHQGQISGNIDEGVRATNSVAENNSGKLTQQEQDEQARFRAALDAQTRRYCEEIERAIKGLNKKADEMFEKAKQQDAIIEKENERIAIYSARKEKIVDAIKSKDAEQMRAALRDEGIPFDENASEAELQKLLRARELELNGDITKSQNNIDAAEIDKANFKQKGTKYRNDADALARDYEKLNQNTKGNPEENAAAIKTFTKTHGAQIEAGLAAAQDDATREKLASASLHADVQSPSAELAAQAKQPTAFPSV